MTRAPDKSLLSSVRKAVTDFSPDSPREAEARWRFLNELDELDDPFDRYAGPVHVTGSALVLGRRGTVLLLHRKLGIWVQPGGHLEPGETPGETALRETAEETGLEVRHPAGGPLLVHLDVHPSAADHVHLDMRYLVLAEDAEPSPPPDESQDVRWFGLDEAVEMAASLPDGGLADGLRRLRLLARPPDTLAIEL